MKTKIAMLLWLLSIPLPALAHIEVSSIKNERDIGKVKTCKNGINSVEATSGVVKLWALQEFGDQTSLVLAEREEIQTNLRGRIGFLVKYILMGEAGFDMGRVFVSTCGTVFEFDN